MKTFYLSIGVLLISISMYAQSNPYVVIEDDIIQDVLVQGDKTYVATSRSIVEIDAAGNKRYLDDRYSVYLNGRLFEKEDGWIYIGWRYFADDHTLPNLLLANWDGDTLTRKHVSFLDISFATHLAVTYQSEDSIYILADDFDKARIFQINKNGSLLNDDSHDLGTVKDMLLLKDNINLVVGWSKLFKIRDESIIDNVNANAKILDAYINREEETIDVLTEAEIRIYDFEFNLLETFPIPNSERERQAFFREDGINYLLEHGDRQSVIVALDVGGNIMSEHEEDGDVLYNDLRVKDGQYKVWGGNYCPIGKHILKSDTVQFQSQIPLIDLKLDFFTADLIGLTYDTVVHSNGNTSITKKYVYSWSLSVSNLGDQVVEHYRASSTRIHYFYGPRYLEFTEDEALIPGESRTHEGQFELTTHSGSSPNFHFSVWVGTDKYDLDCADNVLQHSLTTTSVSFEDLPEWKLYPNPTDGILYVDEMEEYSFSIYNLQGLLCQKGWMNADGKIDLTGLSKGIYIVQIDNGKKIERQKIILI